MASAVAREIAAYRAEIDAASAPELKRLRKAYETIINNTARKADALAKEINAMREAGEIVSNGRLVRMERYNLLLADLQRQCERYAIDVATPSVTQLQEENAWLAQQHAARTERIILGPELTGQVAERFVMVNAEAVEAIAGTMGDGGNVRNYLLETLTKATVDHVGNALVEGIGGGLGPREVARMAAQASGLGLTRAATIARTEMLRAYRESQRQRWEQSGLVHMYRRTAAQNPRTCLGCIVMDGTVFPISEELADHPNGKCFPVPVFVLPNGEVIQPPGMTSAREWLAQEPEDVQKHVMGPKRWAAWKRGDVQLHEMARYVPNERFGDSWAPRRVRDIVNAEPVDAAVREAQQRTVQQIA